MFRYDVVNKYLQDEGRTRKWFTDHVGVPAGSMNQYLSGHREPSLPVLRRMSEIMNVPVADLLECPVRDRKRKPREPRVAAAS